MSLFDMNGDFYSDLLLKRTIKNLVKILVKNLQYLKKELYFMYKILFTKIQKQKWQKQKRQQLKL